MTSNSGINLTDQEQLILPKKNIDFSTRNNQNFTDKKVTLEIKRNNSKRKIEG